MGVFDRLRNLKERYQRPHFYAITVGTTAICASPNNQRQPVLSVLFQADLANMGNISIADGTVSAFNGLQLDPGRAIQFSIFDLPLSGTMGPGISQVEQIQVARTLQKSELELYIDIADFFIIGDAAGLVLRVFWSTVSR